MIDPNKPIVDHRMTFFDEENTTPPPAGDGQTENGNTPPPVSDGKTGNQQPQAKQQDGGTPPAAVPSGSSTTTTTKTTTSVPISTSIPAEYTASSYAELIPQLEKRMAEYKPLSEEELKKLRRRQKAEGIISGISDAVQSVANLVFTHHYAPNMYNPKESMSAKTKERFDKEKAQREADADKFLNYALTIGKMKDADKQRGLQAWQTEQTLARQDRAFDAGRKDREDDVAFRNKDYDERVRQWQAGFDRQGEWHKEEGERWEKQFKESVRQFNVNAAHDSARIGLEKKRLGMEAQRLARELQQGQMTFNLGSGNGNVTLSIDKLNAQTVSRIYHTLPASVRSTVQGDPIVQNGFVVGYKEPTTEAMLIAIGANVETSPATQNAIKQVAGLEKGEKPKGY